MNIKLYSLVSVEALRFKYIRDTHVMTSLQKTPFAKPRASARLHLRQKVQKDGVGSLVLDEPRSEMRSVRFSSQRQAKAKSLHLENKCRGRSSMQIVSIRLISCSTKAGKTWNCKWRIFRDSVFNIRFNIQSSGSLSELHAGARCAASEEDLESAKQIP